MFIRENQMGRRLVGLLQMALIMLGSVVVSLVSYIVFGVLDLLDPLLCVVYKVVDYLVEAEWKPCYCFSAQKDCSSKSRRSILVNSPEGKTKIVCHCLTKVQMEDISDTLYSRKPLFRELVMSTVFCIKKLRVMNSKPSIINQRLRTATLKPAFPVNSSTIVESLQAHKGQLKEPLSPRWSDCDCHTCASWHSSCKETLFVKVEGRGSEIFDVPQENNNNNNHNLKASASDVIFIHGFISSSTFWTETVFPNFSELTKSKYRLFAVDLLGFGRSPKPTDSLYTLTEHVDMIERSVLRPHRVKSFHVVAHSLGCIIALALAARFPGAVSSLTLLAPPYFPVPRGVGGSDFVLRQLAPKKVWPPIAFGASVASWYEHVSRTVCLLICKQHRFWDFIAKQITRNRIRTFLIDGFMCHTHHSAWHTLHNVICGTANKMDVYLDLVRKQETCKVTVFHGRDDELLPAKCSEDLKCKIPRARVKIIEKTDHITIVVGRQKIFARELEEIWKEKEN